MALEHRDWYREKKPDWDNIKNKKTSLWKRVFITLYCGLLFGLFLIFWFPRPSVVSVPVQSSPVVKPVLPALVSDTRHYETYAELCAAYAADPSFICSSEILASEKMALFMKKDKKQSQLVSTAGGGYSGYIEYNGKRKSVYGPAVKSQTFKYRSVNNVKYLDVEINGIPFEVMLDTGASYVCLSSEALKTLGINQFEKTIKMENVIGTFDAHGFHLFSLKLGSFEVRDIEAFYIPSSSYNLLGGSFLKHFNYSIDESSGTITFVAK